MSSEKNNQFNLNSLLNYCNRFLNALSSQGIYIVLLLYFAYQNVNTPSWAKRIILGSFAYLISPLDSIPDLTPFIGLTDDMGVLSFGLVTIACYIDEAVREKAKLKVSQILGRSVDVKCFDKVDSWL